MAEEAPLKDKVAKGLLWGGVNNGSQQMLNLVIGIFLARLLTPADYGMTGVLAVFSAIASVLQEGGFVSALTNRRNASANDFNSVFWFNVTCGITFYLILFFLAPAIARFYNLPQLVPLARFIFIGFVLASLNVAPRAYLYRNMRVKDMAVTSIISLAISGFAGIYLAYNGFAYWGLAWQQVIFIGCSTLFTFYFAGWYPRFRFSLRPVKEMLGYSSKIVITNVFNILNNNIFSVLLGKFYSPGDVGDYNQANKWNTMGAYTISGMLHGVTQPAFARVADDQDRQIQVMRKFFRFTAFATFPAMLGLSFVARDFIVIAITEKWLFSAYILSILCIGGTTAPFVNIFSNYILSRGRSSAYMWSTVSLAACQMLAVCFTYPYGLVRMLWIYVAINIIWLYIWHRVTRKSLPLKFQWFLRDILPYLFVTVIAIAIAFFITRSIENVYLALLSKITIVAVIYTGVLWLSGSVILKEGIKYIRKPHKTGK